MRGWVYVKSNKAMPGLIKVGYSSKAPELRAKELNNTGCPYSYIVEYDMLIDEPFQIEQRVHKLLAAKGKGKGWFECSTEEAIGAIQKIADGSFISHTLKKQTAKKAKTPSQNQRTTYTKAKTPSQACPYDSYKIASRKKDEALRRQREKEEEFWGKEQSLERFFQLLFGIFLIFAIIIFFSLPNGAILAIFLSAVGISIFIFDEENKKND